MVKEKKTKKEKETPVKKTVVKTSAKEIKVKKERKQAEEKASVSASKSVVQPRTMEELLAQTGWKVQTLKAGQIVEGTVTEKTRRALFVDVNAKTEGVVLDRDFKEAKDLVSELKAGDKIEVMVVQPENDSGQVVLSLKKASLDRAWDFFEEKMKTDESFEVSGREMNKGGLIVNSWGVQGFIPASQFSAQYMGRINGLLNKKLMVKVIEVDREKNRLILSERAVSEAEMLAAQKEVLGKVKVGEAYEAEITAVMPFGFFAKIHFDEDGNKTFLEGLIHISEISWERVNDIRKHGQAGDKVKVKVLAVDEKSGKLNLSMKQLGNDPWSGVDEKYPKDKKVKGTVSRIAPFGFFVTLSPGIEGLVHISKIPAGFQPKTGEEVNCFVDSLDLTERKMSLGLVLTTKPVGYK